MATTYTDVLNNLISTAGGLANEQIAYSNRVSLQPPTPGLVPNPGFLSTTVTQPNFLLWVGIAVLVVALVLLLKRK